MISILIFFLGFESIGILLNLVMLAFGDYPLQRSVERWESVVRLITSSIIIIWIVTLL